MDDEELARLLSGRNAPSVLAKEKDASDVIARLSRERRTRRLLMSASAVTVAAAAFALAFVGRKTDEGTFSVRGKNDAPVFEARCDATRVSCKRGDTLAFEVPARAGYAYFAAFARREDKAVLWYLPSPNGRSELVSSDGTRLSAAVVLGPEHTPGTYQLFGIFSKEPLTRDEIRVRLGPELSGRDGVSVVQRDLRVEGSP